MFGRVPELLRGRLQCRDGPQQLRLE